jgi:hypothetical protein
VARPATGARPPAPAWLWFLSAGIGLAAGGLGVAADNNFALFSGLAWAVIATARGVLATRRAGGAPQ